MLFNSIQFLVFFIIVTTTYFNIPHKYRWILLFISSCYFYMAFIPRYILILFFLIIIDYFAGILIERASLSFHKKLYLVISLISNIGLLSIFKYYNFFTINLEYVFKFFNSQTPIPYLNILLPIGLSFHTFQAMSYTIEVYRGNQKAERNIGIYALYVMFYPQLVAGPIERPYNLIPQLYKKQSFNFDEFLCGIKIMIWGFFKKVVIADRLAIVVNSAYYLKDPFSFDNSQNGLTLLIGTFFFAFQIYCDFSGYSDIAIGAARIMGIKLMNNFNLPYFAKSISEFWRRWHISLSTWFRDYLYIPLGGNRVKEYRWYFNLAFVFLITGFWHGANWTFIFWGALHGFYLIAEIFKSKITDKLKLNLNVPFFSMFITFILVCFSWIFFRAYNIQHAIYIIKQIFTLSLDENLNVPMHINEIVFCFLLIVFLLFKEKIIPKVENSNTKFSFVFSIIIFSSCYFFGIFTQNQFIYFQF